MKKTLRGALLIAAGILVAASTSLALHTTLQDRSVEPQSATATDAQSYPLLSKRLFVDQPNDIILNFSPLRRDLRETLSKSNVNHSFYMEYLPSGTSIKINQDNPMVAASLLKVPVVMNLMKAVEKNEAKLNDTVSIQNGDIDKRSGTLWQKGVGAQITLEEAARQAIVNSDNTAVNMMIGAASGKYDLFEAAIDELDVNLSVENDTQTTIGAQGYSSLIKCLYLSCFNSYEHSQKILQWMTESQSPPRLAFELPEGTVVAHKYGTSGGRSESDCGLVYIPQRPYILCIMVDAPPEEANVMISQISKKVYDYVSSVK